MSHHDSTDVEMVVTPVHHSLPDPSSLKKVHHHMTMDTIRSKLPHMPHAPKVNASARTVALFFVYFAVFIDMIGSTLLIPTLPFIALKLGASSSLIGLMYAVYAAAMLVSGLVLGRLSDRLGRRRIFLLCLLGSCIGCILQGLATEWNFASFITLRGLTGLVSGSMPVAQAYIADVTKPEERPRYLSLIGSTMALALLFGPAIGSGLSQFSLAVPLYVAAGVAFVGFVLAFGHLKDSSEFAVKLEDPPSKDDVDNAESGTATGRSNSSDGAGGSATDSSRIPASPLADAQSLEKKREDESPPWKLIVPMLFSLWFHWFGFSAFQSMFAIFVGSKFGVGSLEIGFVFTGASLVLMAGQLFVFNRLRGIIGLLPCAALGTLVTGVGLATIPLGDRFVFIIPSIACLAIGGSLVTPSMSSQMSVLATKKTQGTIMGLNSASQSAGRVLAPIILGVLFGVDPSLPFYVGGCACVAGATCSMTLYMTNRTVFKIVPQTKPASGGPLSDLVDQLPKAEDLIEIDLTPEEQETAQRIGLFAGRLLKQRHYRRWVQNEKTLCRLMMTMWPDLGADSDVQARELMIGNVLKNALTMQGNTQPLAHL